MVDQRDYYEVLGVDRRAASAEITAAYRKLAIRFHPDKNPGDPAAAASFKEAARAFEVLSDDELRGRYDRYGHAGVEGGRRHDFNDISDVFEAFGDLFGGSAFGGRQQRARARKGRDVFCQVNLSLVEAARGVTKTVEFDRHETCAECDGSGARNGPTPHMVKPELDLLQAEGLYRAGDFAGAAALVNVTRVRNGLPAITEFNATARMPGGADCVPKVPVAPFNVVACGTLWDALKYEKRIETAYTAYAPWFLDGRGWGELPKDTPLFWAVPYQDLQARGTAVSAIYGAGPGAGNAAGSAAPVSVYGW